jgi:hypothetical protein
MPYAPSRSKRNKQTKDMFQHWIFTCDYWVFELCPSSEILKDTQEQNILETGSVPTLR